MRVSRVLRISPETPSSQMPLPPLRVIAQSVMRISPADRQWISPRRFGSAIPPPSSVMPSSVMPSAPSASSSDGPPLKTSRVAPRTPIRCVPAGSFSRPQV